MRTMRYCGIVLLWAASLIAWSSLAQTAAASDDAPAPASSATPAEPSDQSAKDSDRDEDSDDEDQSDWEQPVRIRIHRPHHDLVSVGHDSELPAGERADSVVSIFGSSTVNGDTTDAVSVLGNTKVTGSARQSAVAVLGNTTVDGTVGGDVVAVMGNVQLGPNANVGGDVVAVGGKVDRAPGAQVRGTVQAVIGGFSGFSWLRPWIDHCLFYGRPLALAPGLGWAWSLALALLALYVCIALLFRDGVSRCVQTLESQPGMTLVAALITVLLTPILLVLLCITFVGIAAVPFVAVALLCMGLFGKAVMLAWLGHRALGARGAERFGQPAVAVLVGGLIVLVLYLVPVLGFIVYKVLGLFGLGAVVYTLVQLARERRADHSARPSGRNADASAARAGAVAGAASAAAAAGGAGSRAEQPDSRAAPNPAIPPEPVPGPGAGPAPVHPAAAAISAAGLPRAGFWIRMAALLLDTVLVGILVSMIHHMSDAMLLILAIYGALMWKLRGATVGGIVFDLQVVRLDDRPVDWETAIIRALGCFLSMAVIGLGFIWIAFDPGKQAWHDKIAGTAVVRVRKGVPLV